MARRLSATTTPSGLSLAVGSKPLGRATAPVTVEMIRQDGRSWTYEDSFIPGQDKAVAFGAALSMHHNILAVGMAEKDDGHGLVYLMQFQGNSWTEITRFESPSDQPAAFGAVVELGANTLAVGAPAYSASESPNDNSGAVYMFQTALMDFRAPGTIRFRVKQLFVSRLRHDSITTKHLLRGTDGSPGSCKCLGETTSTFAVSKREQQARAVNVPWRS